MHRNAQQRFEAGGLEVGGVVMRYMVVIEQGASSFGAYVPDLPGCIAVGGSKQEVLQQIQEELNDYEDFKELRQAEKAEKNAPTVSFEEAKKELGL